MWQWATQDGFTALFFAIINAHADCVRLLLEAGADKEAKDTVRVLN
jgi:ankyrin repeat protein